MKTITAVLASTFCCLTVCGDDKFAAEFEKYHSTKPQTFGPIQIEVRAAIVGRVPVVDALGQRTKSKSELIAIGIRLRNVSEKVKVTYRGYMEDLATLRGTRARLYDDSNNRYREIDFGLLTKVDGATTSKTLYPDDEVRDAIVFERPVKGFEYLKLVLSRKAFDQEGDVTFYLPNSLDGTVAEKARIADEKEAEARKARIARELAAKAAAKKAAAEAYERSFRTWTSGKYTVEARFVSYANGSVKLQLRNKKTLSIKYDLLSEFDQAFIKSKRQ